MQVAEWKKLDKSVEFPAGFKVFCWGCKEETIKVPGGITVCLNDACKVKVASRHNFKKTKPRMPERGNGGRFLPDDLKAPPSPRMLSEKEATALVQFLTAFPLSGYNNKSHAILVGLLRRLRGFPDDN